MSALEIEHPSPLGGEDDADDVEEDKLDSEMESLFLEVPLSDHQTTSIRMRKRSAVAAESISSRMGSAVQDLYAALPERNRFFSMRGASTLAGLSILVFVYLGRMEERIYEAEGGFHQPSFGGISNVAHPVGARKYAEGGKFEEIVIPVSNVGDAIPSLSAENVRNLWGHYVHDEHFSPYASPLYDRNLSELQAEQKSYEEKMAEVRRTWGAWNFTDDFADRGDLRRRVDFDSWTHRDAPVSAFPSDSWQSDGEYVRRFLSEARLLVDRVREGIYAELGRPTRKADGTGLLSADERAKRESIFAVGRDGATDPAAAGIGWMNPNAWEGLVRKLLHAMMTNDEFYVVLAGHSSAAGHGNNFVQTKAMAFHHLMEPVFDKLGVRLISRNMAQGGVGTMPSVFGGADIYGEKDIIWWDSAMTEHEKGSHDMFNRQAILSGERVPVILSAPPGNILEASNGTAWIGELNLYSDRIVPTTVDEEQAKAVPWALRFMKCESENQELCNEAKYNSICWEPRVNVTPSVQQAAHPEGQVSIMSNFLEASDLHHFAYPRHHFL